MHFKQTGEEYRQIIVLEANQNHMDQHSLCR